MNEDTLYKGFLTENFTGIDPATYAMVHERAKELALMAGRISPQVAQVDYEQAKREVARRTSDAD